MRIASPAPTIEQFRFTGSGGEYFRIWIVNLLLSVVTLGIYSAWAKVRRMRYFYGNTQLAGDVFEYHGQPRQILKGRLIAFGMFLVYLVVSAVSELAARNVPGTCRCFSSCPGLRQGVHVPRCE